MAFSVDDILSNEVGDFTPFYIKMMFGYHFADYTHTALIFLTVFVAAPAKSLEVNPFNNHPKTIIDQWDLDHDSQKWIPTFLQSLLFLGFMFGTMIFGQLSDRYGRRYTGIRLYTLLCIVCFGAIFCTSWHQFAFMRFCGGLGIGGITITNIVMVQETSGAKIWAFNGNLTCVSFSMTMIELVAIAYLFPDWKVFCFMSSLPVLIGWYFFWIVPESPRWLYSQSRYEDCTIALQNIAAINGNINAKYTIQEPDVELVSHKANSKEKFMWLDLICNPVLRTRSIVLGFMCRFIIIFVFYCVTLAAGSFSNHFYIAFLMSAISQLFSVPITYYFMEHKRFGRKGTFKIVMLMIAFGLLLMVHFPLSLGFHKIRLALSMVAKIGAQGAFTLVYIMTPEVYPTTLRNLGLGTMSTCARVGSILAPVAAEDALRNNSFLPFLICSILCLVCTAIVSAIPETRGRRIANSLQELKEIEGTN